jgi:hypothetical protein
MTSPPQRRSVGDYQIGYGKPPNQTRFRPGLSGNPRGRPRGAPAGRAERLLLQEIYRLITVREGEQTLTLPTIQAMMRQLARIALKGNGAALRTYFGIVQAIDQRAARQAAVDSADKRQMRVTEEARLNAFRAFINKVRLRDQ